MERANHNKAKKPEKMEYGYLKRTRRFHILMILLMVALGAGIFVLGLALNKWEISNIFTVIAVLFVLPMARYATVFAVLAPYKTTSKELYDKAVKTAGENAIVSSDLVFTSTETGMHLDLLVFTGGYAIGYSADGKKAKEAEDYINAHFKEKKMSIKANVYTDEAKFFSAVASHKTTAEESRELTEARDSMRYFMV